MCMHLAALGLFFPSFLFGGHPPHKCNTISANLPHHLSPSQSFSSFEATSCKMRLLALVGFYLLLAATPVPASILSEVSKEQLFLLQRRGELNPVTAIVPARALPSAATLSKDAVSTMPSHQLHRLLADRHVDCHGCVERRELAERALEVYQMPTTDQRVAMMLTTLENTPLTFDQFLHNQILFATAVQGNRCLVMENSTICNTVTVV